MLTFSFDLLENRFSVYHTTLENFIQTPPKYIIYTIPEKNMTESSMSHNPSMSVAVALVEEREEVRALEVEKEELIGQLVEHRKLAQKQAGVIEKLQGQRNYFLMLLLGVCVGLSFVIFGIADVGRGWNGKRSLFVRWLRDWACGFFPVACIK